MLELKLKNNPNLRIYDSSSGVANNQSSKVSDNFKQKTTGIMITDCPNIDALGIFDTVSAYQTNSGNINLSNIRIQLKPTQSGSTYTYVTTGNYDKLCTYVKVGSKNLSGYDENGNAVPKPALVGTWRVNDYIDSTMADAITGSDNGMFLFGFPMLSADYIIDWDDIAVQSVDSTKRNYNPALSIILHEKGFGHVYENTDHFNGKWWITNAEASRIKDIGVWLKSVSSVMDEHGLVSNLTSATYQLTELDELSGFTGIETLATSAFCGNENLVSVRLPSNLKSIAAMSFSNCSNLTSIGDILSELSSVQASAFNGCVKLQSSTLGNNITEIEEGAFDGCGNVTFSSLPENLKYVSNSAFKSCSSISISSIPSTVGYIGRDAFNGCTEITEITIGKHADTDTNILSGAFNGTTGNIYIGDSDSSWLDEKLKRYYSNDSETSNYASRFVRKYFKDYSALIDASTYEIQDYICSDGISNIALTDTIKINKDTKMSSDISFCLTPSNSGDAIHGSENEGLNGRVGIGLVGNVGGDTYTIRTSSDYSDGSMHNYWIDQKNFTIGMDGTKVFDSTTSTEMSSGSDITFFGDSTRKFIGSSWMNKIYENGVLNHDYVPVKRISDGTLGFYDVKTNTFIAGGNYYSSNDTQLNPSDSATDNNSIVTEGGDTLIF